MLHAKSELVEVIKNEIYDRECTMTESDGTYDTTKEVNSLKQLLVKVENEQSLEFNDYSWLTDLVATDTRLND